MSVLTVRKDVRRQEGNILSYPVKASTKIVEGSLVNIVAGYAVASADTAAHKFVGVCDELADNSGSAVDGAIRVKVWNYGVIDVAAGFSAAATDLGKEVYVDDNQTVDLLGGVTNGVFVGRIVEVLSASKLRVELQIGQQNAASINALIAAAA